MKKILLLALSIFGFFQLSAQKPIASTNQFTIEGLVEKEWTINLDSLKKYPMEKLDSLVITNHLGEKRSTLKNIKGVQLKYFLDKIKIKTESPKVLSECYFVFIASDGYKVVYSWNEIFNTKNGQGIYVIVERDGKKIENLDDRISIFSRADFMTGRRYVKGISKIIVKRVE